MRIQSEPPLHLTYCLNVHPGETWRENFSAIRDYALKVRDAVAPDKPFGLGLRLSNEAAISLSEKETLEEFRRFLSDNNLYVFTINGFPYGRFHRTRVKKDVYKPDWRTAERRDYTVRLADILAALLPDGVSGSVSTVPCSYKPWIGTEEDVRQMLHMLMDCVAHLAEIHERDGKLIQLGLEPEPGCYLESAEDVIEFFNGPVKSYGAHYLSGKVGRSLNDAEAMIKRHLGVCFDTCHAAVRFENPAEGLESLRENGIQVAKIQISSALRAHPTPATVEKLREFLDPVYLHQVCSRADQGDVRRYADLSDALAAAAGEAAKEPAEAEWRIHFHVPLFFEEAGEISSTAQQLSEKFWETLKQGFTSNLEIETYTFDVLPGGMRGMRGIAVTESIAKEYDWVLGRLGKE